MILVRFVCFPPLLSSPPLSSLRHPAALHLQHPTSVPRRSSTPSDALRRRPTLFATVRRRLRRFSTPLGSVDVAALINALRRPSTPFDALRRHSTPFNALRRRSTPFDAARRPQLAFRSAQSLLALKKEHIRRILHLPAPPHPGQQPAPADPRDPRDAGAAKELEQHVSAYLRRTVDSFDLTKSIDEVCSQIWATLYDYPSLKTCSGLLQYVRDSVRLAWALVNQTPAYVLEYEQRLFRRDVHVRFHASNPESEAIRTYLWPALLEGTAGPCVHKAVVIT